MPSYLVTGASRGLGFEFVLQLSADPENQVFALVRNKATSNRLTSLLNKNIHIVEADISDHKAIKAVAGEVSRHTGGKLDVLINNAAHIELSRGNLDLEKYESEEVLEKDLRDSFDTNVIGVIHTINSFLPLLRSGQAKKVITLSTFLADTDFTLRTGFTFAGPYTISKAAVNMVNAKYAIQHKDEGFAFVALSPGFVDTATSEPDDEMKERLVRLLGMLRQYKPDFEGAISPEESVKAQLRVIANISARDSGAFISHHGDRTWL